MATVNATISARVESTEDGEFLTYASGPSSASAIDVGVNTSDKRQGEYYRIEIPGGVSGVQTMKLKFEYVSNEAQSVTAVWVTGNQTLPATSSEFFAVNPSVASFVSYAGSPSVGTPGEVLLHGLGAGENPFGISPTGGSIFIVRIRGERNASTDGTNGRASIRNVRVEVDYDTGASPPPLALSIAGPSSVLLGTSNVYTATRTGGDTTQSLAVQNAESCGFTFSSFSFAANQTTVGFSVTAPTSAGTTTLRIRTSEGVLSNALSVDVVGMTITALSDVVAVGEDVFVLVQNLPSGSGFTVTSSGATYSGGFASAGIALATNAVIYKATATGVGSSTITAAKGTQSVETTVSIVQPLTEAEVEQLDDIQTALTALNGLVNDLGTEIGNTPRDVWRWTGANGDGTSGRRVQGVEVDEAAIADAVKTKLGRGVR